MYEKCDVGERRQWGVPYCWVQLDGCLGHTRCIYRETWRQAVVPKRPCLSAVQDGSTEVYVESKNQCSHCCCQAAKLLVVFQIVCHLCWICCVFLHFCTSCDSSWLPVSGTKKCISVLGSQFHTPDLFRVKVILSKLWSHIRAIEVHLHSFPHSALQRGLSFTHQPLYPHRSTPWSCGLFKGTFCAETHHSAYFIVKSWRHSKSVITQKLKGAQTLPAPK
jgi:hypothetical protein